MQKLSDISKKEKNSPSPGIFSLLSKYAGIISLLVILTVIANALTVAVPEIISVAIDTYKRSNFIIANFIIEFSIVAIFIFIFTYLQNIVQIYASEKVARDMRNDITAKISVQPYSYIENATPSKLLTNLTSDVDAVKTFVSMAVSSIISSVFLILVVSVLLIITNWRLGLTVILIMPFIGVTSRSNRLAQQSYKRKYLGRSFNTSS